VGRNNRVTPGVEMRTNEYEEHSKKKLYRTQHTTNHAMILTYIKKIMKHERNTNERNVNWSFLRSCEFKVDLWCICNVRRRRNEINLKKFH
jgi:hypothetical protein